MITKETPRRQPPEAFQNPQNLISQPRERQTGIKGQKANPLEYTRAQSRVAASDDDDCVAPPRGSRRAIRADAVKRAARAALRGELLDCTSFISRFARPRDARQK